MTAESLRDQTRKQLETLARRDGIAGWHGMTKEELIAALVRQFRSKGSGSANGRAAPKLPSARRSTRRESPDAATSRKRPTQVNRAKSAGASTNPSRSVVVMSATGADSVNVTAEGPHWLSVEWTVSQGMARRAEAALGRGWRNAVPVLRLFDVTSEDDRGSARTWVQDVEIHGNDPRWFLRVDPPGRTWTVELGFRTADGDYFRIAHSPPATTPANHGMHVARTAPIVDSSRDGRVSRSVASLIPRSVLASRLRPAASATPLAPSTSSVQVRTELLVTGVAHPDATLTLMSQPIPLGPDGSFALRVPLDGGRQVIPADVVSPDGGEQRTVILTIDQNIRHLEPQVFDESAE